MVEEEHFGRKLAELMGIDLDELIADVNKSKAEQIQKRPQFKLNDDLYYIKNSYEYFKDTPIHYLSNKRKFPDCEYILKIGVYKALTNLKSDPSLNNAIWTVEDYYLYEEELTEFLFKNNLIESYEFGDGFWDYVYEINTYNELKSYMDDENIDSSGDKRDLVNRIKKLNLYEDFNEFNFKLSEKGVEYLNSISWIKYYLIFLDRFDFFECEKYLTKDIMNSALEFLNKHNERAIEKNDLTQQFDAQASKALYYIVNEDFRNALDEEIKLFIIRLNPIYENEDELLFHEAINQVNIYNLNNLLNICKIEELERLFNRNWDSLNLKNSFSSKKESFIYFTDALNGKNLDDLNRNFENYYFEE